MINIHKLFFVIKENDIINIRDLPKNGYETELEASDVMRDDCIIVTYQFLMHNIRHNLWIEQQTIGCHD
jgi:hypothetical protein